MAGDFSDLFRTYAPGVSALAAVGALLKALYEYAKQNRFRRFEKLQEMSQRFDENETIQKICELLLDDSDELARLSRHQKEVFICFIEEVAFMKNSNFINKNIGAYTFGHYAVLALDSPYFWSNISKSDYYYQVFVRFAEECRGMRAKRTAQQNWDMKV